MCYQIPPATEFEHMGISVRIEYDQDPESPREWDNAGKMVCWHRRYNLGDKHDYSDPEAFWAGLFDDCELTDEEVRVVLLGIIRDEYGLHEYQDAFSSWSDYHKDKACFRYDFVKNWVSNNRDNLNSDQRQKVQDVVLARHVILPLYLYDHSGLSMSTSGFSCPWDSGQVGYIFISDKDAEKEWPYHPEHGTTVERAIKYLKASVETYDDYLTGQVFGFVVEHEEVGEESCWGFYGEEYCIEEAKSVAEHMAGKLAEMQASEAEYARKLEEAEKHNFTI